MSRPNESDHTAGEVWPIIRAQPRSFFKAPLCTNLDELDADVAIIGVPFDQGTFGRPGARFGPDAIRDAPGDTTTRTPTALRLQRKGSTTSTLRTSCCGA